MNKRIMNASKYSGSLEDAINEAVQSPDLVFDSVQACEVFGRLDVAAKDFFNAASKFNPEENKSECDKENVDSMRRVEGINIDLEMSAFGDNLEKIRANSGKVSEEECVSVLIDTISSTFDILKKDQHEIILKGQHKRNKPGGSPQETPHSKRRYDFGI
mmetsp:Transcript_15064/g.23377  ORF Transcript_15064/g.23377 Transcript_15064/m.23377 type:complete len:159 (-) Transcript_15064:2430-2906(-)